MIKRAEIRAGTAFYVIEKGTTTIETYQSLNTLYVSKETDDFYNQLDEKYLIFETMQEAVEYVTESKYVIYDEYEKLKQKYADLLKYTQLKAEYGGCFDSEYECKNWYANAWNNRELYPESKVSNEQRQKWFDDADADLKFIKDFEKENSDLLNRY